MVGLKIAQQFSTDTLIRCDVDPVLREWEERGWPLSDRLRILLISPDYRRLWLAQAFSSFGEYLFASTCTVWVATQLFPDSPRLPALVGAVVLSASILRIVAGPIAGVYADRWHARKTMIINDSIRAGLFAVLLFVVQFGKLKHDQIFIVILRISAVSGPMMAMTSAASTLLASQALSFASEHGLTAGNGAWDDLYRIFIIFGATFLVIGGGAMYAAQSRPKQTSQSPSSP